MRPKRAPPCLCAPTRPTGDAEHVSWYNDHLRALHCSEMMLTPKTILKGRWYVDGIAAWVKDRRRRGGETCPQRMKDGETEAERQGPEALDATRVPLHATHSQLLLPRPPFGRSSSQVFGWEQLKVIAVEELSAAPQRVMNETFTFLGLPAVAVGNRSRFCVRGLHGVMKVPGRKDSVVMQNSSGGVESAAADGERVSVGDCGGGEAAGGAGTRKYEIDPLIERPLRRFFAKSNQQLFKLLGRDLGWGY